MFSPDPWNPCDGIYKFGLAGKPGNAKIGTVTTGSRPNSWILRSLLVGAISSLLDVAVLLLTRKLGFPTALSAACGVSLGAASNFYLNRRFSFRAESAPMLPAALRFSAGTAVLVALHAMCVGLLVDEFQIPLLLAKYGSDAGILLGGNLLLMRYLVFPAPARSKVEARRVEGQALKPRILKAGEA